MICPVRVCLGGSRLGKVTAFRSGQATASEWCFSRIEGDPGLYWQRADGTATAERLTTPDKGTAHIPESWSTRDQGFSFSAVAGPSVSLWTFSISEKKGVPFGDVRSTAPLNSEFSPDGRWLAYTLRTGNLANEYVEPYPATGAKVGKSISTRAEVDRKHWAAYREEREPKVARAADTRRLAICSVR
jgi:hypothetical protein